MKEYGSTPSASVPKNPENLSGFFDAFITKPSLKKLRGLFEISGKAVVVVH